jgi:uncharacterized protein YqgQ
MKRLTSYLVLITTVVAAVAAVPTAQAGNPNAAALRAIELRSQELGKLCQNPTLSRAVYLSHCGPTAQASNPNAAALRAIELRSQELGKVCQNPTLSREVYVSHCGTKRAGDHPTAAELRALEVPVRSLDHPATVQATPTSGGFDWAEFGIGAGSTLGLVLLAGGVATGVRYGRKGSVRPRPAP